MGRTYRILSIDGGGIRGALSVALLQQLSATPALAGWLGKIDLVAGTSTGGLIALGLGKGLSLDEILGLYQDRGERIFKTSVQEKLLERLDPTHALDKLLLADYNTEDLERELIGVLGPTTRLDDLGVRLLITAFDLDNADESSIVNDVSKPEERAKKLEERQQRRAWKPKIFHNIPGEDSDGHVLAYKVGVYTSAAPTYFPVADGYVDGGVFASNPAMCALAQARDARNQVPHRAESIDQVVLFSLGTGFSLKYQEGQSLDWGYVPWAVPLVSIMLDGVAGIADYQCRQLLGDRYARLAPVFPAGISVDMDDVARVPWMIDFAARIAQNRPEQDDQLSKDNVDQYRKSVEFLKSYWMPD